ncbi:MAG TPA: class I SAM-dependent methyltransferase [Pyrinomonadaceae bacterium]|nr:class I SAM-dependent methyltransferase [Pyrinomonadaceae bacterium]
MIKPVDRFSNRVENYVKYRPGYPYAIISLLQTECGLTPKSIVADIGSGTGKLSELFLDNGNRVLAVEPNEAMRVAGEKLLNARQNFVSVNGTSEATTLDSASVDFVTAGQAFHWFDPVATRLEFARILRPGGWVALVWNDRKLEATPFLKDYETLLLEFGTDYQEVRNDKDITGIARFFAPTSYLYKSFPNRQLFDLEGLRGRVLSSSYAPQPDSPKFGPMMKEIEHIFFRNQCDGLVSFDYDTKVFYGQL